MMTKCMIKPANFEQFSDNFLHIGEMYTIYTHICNTWNDGESSHRPDNLRISFRTMGDMSS